MPEATVSLRWALQVQPDMLCAHLTAYVGTLSAITAFKCCQRYGKGTNGERPAMSKLPNELVNESGEYLIENERIEERTYLEQAYNCWRSTCNVLDHYTMNECATMYKTFTGDHRSESQATRFGGVILSLPDGLHDEAKARLEQHVRKSINHDSPSDWISRHKENWEQWQAQVGIVGEASRGIFTMHKNLLFKHFGLDVWIAHTQLQSLQPGQESEEGIISATLAYLVLPTTGQITKEFGRRISDEDGMMEIGCQWLPNEVGYAMSCALPSMPTQSFLRRFPRALRMLGLTPIKAPGVDLFAMNEDAVYGIDGTVANVEAHKNDLAPGLMFFVSNRDDVHDINY